MYCETPWLGRIGLFESPTTAIVGICGEFSRVRSFEASSIFRPGGTSPLHVGKIAPLAGFQSGKLEKADLHAAELLHQHAEVLEHQADLVLPALDQLDFVPGVLRDASAA